MSSDNAPDNWNDYRVTCRACGHRWHLSEGVFCRECERRQEEGLEPLWRKGADDVEWL